jgi:hypothetical protein
VFERLGGGPVGLVGGDAAGDEESLRRESPIGQESAQRGPDPRVRRVGGESDPGAGMFDALCVEGLVAPERQQQLRHAVGERAQHRSQAAVPDHGRRVGHEPIVVGELDQLDVVGDLYRVRVDRRAEREDSV